MVEILDCTLRDGSYAINFGFTANDTTLISGRLHSLGIPYIEVGHGVGLGASEKGYGAAAATDLDYMRAAKGNWGMFAIPGIASLDDIHMLADQGAGFVRIGCDIERVSEAEEYIKFAREKGLFVFSNLMKSYAVDGEDFKHAVSICIKSGSNCIYVVDSAGNMDWHQVARYVFCIGNECSLNGVKIGFHGHNNLGLANSNAINFVRIGGNIVDTTLSGVGRSGGNVSTEQFIAIMKNNGNFARYNVIDFLDVSDELVKPLFGERDINSLDVISGASGFHSSYMPRILEVATEFRVDPKELIVSVTKYDQVNCPIDVVRQCAAELPKKSVRIQRNTYFGEEQR